MRAVEDSEPILSVIIAEVVYAGKQRGMQAYRREKACTYNRC